MATGQAGAFYAGKRAATRYVFTCELPKVGPCSPSCVPAGSTALDRAGFAVIASGLGECLTSGDRGDIDIVEMERLFLILA